MVSSSFFASDARAGVLQVATSKMNLSEECDLEDYINRSERVSAADIAAICAEAGLHAVRANRYADCELGEL